MFNAEINRALTAAADLINTSDGIKSAKPTPDTLESVEGLKQYLADRDAELRWPASKADRKQVERVRALRGRLRTLWEAAPIESQEPLDVLNELLEGVGTRLEVVGSDAPGGPFREVPIPVSPQVSDVMTATVAAALAYLVVEEETGRLRICKGDDCDAAIVDLTRNRSKLFCDFGNCANRAHVRAYRARQAARKVNTEPSEQQPEAARKKMTKPSAAEKADQLARPTSTTAIAAKEFRDRMKEELLQAREKTQKKGKKAKKKAKKG
ncbi:CGNR zinc finger domain-containing protein [Nesterenkonia flava]|uniref:CGNR zinc finger domain-containing protein n=1 Tax=Nesterenkonia flava TaxID=469799 RepID=A0ABU1FTI5_9MICC|nr:CGNR zinc finger domain-containing protein [Nesterenkonia flava]MDR5711547.1 CGNR zinc finger domain-containing protein [Nesterenkonia flava]